MSTKRQLPSTSNPNSNSSDNGILSTGELRNSHVASNDRFNCSKCEQHSLQPNKPIYYLPCLHILCHACFETLRQVQPSVPVIVCPACKRETTRECIFDDFTYDPGRRPCETSNCENKSLDAVFSKCKTCGWFLCEPCATVHHYSHPLVDASTYIPLGSRCSTQHTPSRFAAYICSCRKYLCVRCSQTHRCDNRVLTDVSTLIRQSTEYMARLAENDRKVYARYQKIYEDIQNRRRQIIAEFHNARLSLAHGVTKTTSLLVHRFNDIRQHLNTLQEGVLTQLSAQERMIAMESQKIHDIVGLETQLNTTKEYNAIPFFSFVKAASVHAAQSCKHQNCNVDQQIPMLNIRVETKLADFCNFLNSFGTVQINGSVSRPKSKFDSSVVPLFDAVPKINAANTTKSAGHSLRTFNGTQHVVVDQEEIKRKLKRLQDPDELRERCEQLENELAYFKTLTAHLESELKQRRVEEVPSSSKTSSCHSSSSNKNTSWADQNNHRQPISVQQHQLIQQLKNHPVLQNMGMRSNVQRVPNNQHARRHGGHTMSGYHDTNFMFQSLQGHQNVTPSNVQVSSMGAQFPPYMQLSSSVPASPQVTPRLPVNNTQVPLASNSMMAQMFPRPTHAPSQDWQYMFRNRAPNPQQLSSNFMNELMRCSVPQTSPSPVQMPGVQRTQIQTPPSNSQSSTSRAGSVSASADITKSMPRSRTDSLSKHSGTKVFEVVNLSDDEEATFQQLNASSSQHNIIRINHNQSGHPVGAGESGVLTPINQVSNDLVFNNSHMDENAVTTSQSHALPESLHSKSADHPAPDSSNIGRIALSSTIFESNDVVSTSEGSVPSLNTDKTTTSTNKSAAPAPVEPIHPPIKLKLRLDNRTRPIASSISQANVVRNLVENKRSPQEDTENHDAWDDFCYVCNEGCDERSGDLGCCSACPKVYHQFCHIPKCSKPMADLPDDWKCGLCVNVEPIREIICNFPQQALLACSRVLLLCFKDPQKAEVFRRSEYSIDADNHINLYKISTRLSKGGYSKITDFLSDVNTLFKNCSKYNPPSSLTADCGRALYSIYQDAVRHYLPAYTKEMWMYVNLYNKSEVPRKKRRVMD